jgi:hypothetical protein
MSYRFKEYQSQDTVIAKKCCYNQFQEAIGSEGHLVQMAEPTGRTTAYELGEIHLDGKALSLPATADHGQPAPSLVNDSVRSRVRE